MIRLALRVERDHAEIALAELLELTAGGVEEIDDGGAIIEYAIYGSPGELPQLPQLQAAVGGALVEVETREIADDWQERWKQFHRPVLVPAPAGGALPSLRVRPPWEPALVPSPALEIVIDPGQAFGTGAHATTKLCLSLLLEATARPPAGGVVDIGTGSGVLAIAAAKLGLSPVLAFDHDPQSVRAARQNASANGIAVEVARLDLRRDPLPELEGRLVLANLLRPLLLELSERMSHAPSALIASGLLAGETKEVAESFERLHGLRARRELQGGEWAALWFEGI